MEGDIKEVVEIVEGSPGSVVIRPSPKGRPLRECPSVVCLSVVCLSVVVVIV